MDKITFSAEEEAELFDKYKPIMIADEAADLLRVDRQRIYEMCRNKTIPFILLGDRQYRFSRQKLENWLENGGNQKEGE